MLDLIIRGGTIVDGTGQPSFSADIGIADGRIEEVGQVGSSARDIIDADGALVTPGFVDVHTHYDGQVTWDDQVDPSASHGVTTVVMGNCGVGFAPVRPGREQELIELMEGVEDIPGTALYEGMPWGAWESYPEYLDYLAGREYALDVGSHIPHGALRTYVMGERGARNEASTAEDIDAMARLVEEGMEAGALGFSTSRIIGHTSLSGEPVPGTFASEDELLGIARAMERAGFGVIESVPSNVMGALPHLGPDHRSTEQEIELMTALSRATGRDVTFSLLQISDDPKSWRRAMDLSREANDAGARLFPQISTRPPGVLISFSAYHPFLRRRACVALEHLPLDQRIVELRKPEVKARILADDDLPPEPGTPMAGLHIFLASQIREFYELGYPLDYEPSRDQSIGAIADRTGQSPESVLYDRMLEADGKAFLMLIQTNYVEGNHDVIREMMVDPNSIAGLGDGGAHVRLICDASMQTHALMHWARDRHRGELLPIELVVNKLSGRNASLYGLHDRGRIAPGYRADINVIDIDAMRLHRPHMIEDLPGGHGRLVQPSEGYLATLVRGVVTRRQGRDTGSRPGRLVRGAQAAPA